MSSGSPLDHRQNFCLGLRPKRLIFLSEKFFAFNKRFRIFTKRTNVPEPEQLPGAIKRSFPFRSAQRLLYNARFEMPITASDNK
jgi:hypothetical protein